MVLDQIIRHKHESLKSRTASYSSQKLAPSHRIFYDALAEKRTSFICEIKPASPSQGLLRKNIDIVEIASSYTPFADAISVLADEEFFHGSLANVKAVSDSVDIPVLCKDVVVSPEQIFEARHYGADVVLLMLSVLDDQKYKECAAIANKLALDIITEVHDEIETRRALKLGAKIIGINNRNLKTLKIDMDTTERLLPLIKDDILVISESGFAQHDQVMRYAPKVDGILVGSSLMRAARIDLALREIIFGRVKICGITNAADAKLAYDAGAYYGGLNFSSTSKRQVSLQDAREIKQGAPLLWGGVFVDQPLDEVITIANELKLDFVQLHGHEGKEYLNDLRPLLPPNCEIWKALRIKDQITIPDRLNADLLLFDSYSEQEMGGSGKTFDWQLIKNNNSWRYAIAGGISSSNATKAMSLSPALIDIASGAEEGDARKKSAQRLNEIFAALRG